MMNKCLVSLALLSHIFLAQATPNNPFAKLTPKICKQAHIWSEKVVSTLHEDLQLTYLNLFALNAQGSIQAFMKCAEYIESQPDMLALYEELGINIMETIRKYAENVQQKINLKKNITEKEEEALWNKLELKIQELIAHINTTYYQTLYNHLTKRNTPIMFMFDENGIIPQEKRAQSLPQSL